MIDDNKILELILLNDRYGDPHKTNIHGSIYASPLTLRYIYHGLLIIKYIKDNDIKFLSFVEIGGGYGGLALITSNLCTFFGIEYNKYYILDLKNVSNFQNKYLELNGMKKHSTINCKEN